MTNPIARAMPQNVRMSHRYLSAKPIYVKSHLRKSPRDSAPVSPASRWNSRGSRSRPIKTEPVAAVAGRRPDRPSPSKVSFGAFIWDYELHLRPSAPLHQTGKNGEREQIFDTLQCHSSSRCFHHDDVRA